MTKWRGRIIETVEAGWRRNRFRLFTYRRPDPGGHRYSIRLLYNPRRTYARSESLFIAETRLKQMRVGYLQFSWRQLLLQPKEKNTSCSGSDRGGWWVYRKRYALGGMGGTIGSFVRWEQSTVGL